MRLSKIYVKFSPEKIANDATWTKIWLPVSSEKITCAILIDLNQDQREREQHILFLSTFKNAKAQVSLWHKFYRQFKNEHAYEGVPCTWNVFLVMYTNTIHRYRIYL